jgi:hypothetical protein
MEKIPDPGSGMNIPDHFSERLETVFRVKKYLNSLPRLRNLFYPGSGIFVTLDPGSRIEKLGS